MKDVEKVIDGLAKNRGDAQGRIAQYSDFLDGYFGRQRSSQNMLSDTSGRPILRMGDLRTELRARRGAPNMLQPIIDDFVSLKGTLPLIKVMPDDDTPEEYERALMRTRVIRGFWEQSNMGVQQINAGFWMSCLGEAIFCLDPLLPEDADDMDPAGIYITVWSPQNCYANFRSGRHSQELDELWIAYDMTAEQIEDEYGYTPQGEVAEVITYYSRKDKQTIIDEERIYGIEHELGFVPAQWARNKMVGNRFAQSDISQALDVHDELQALYLVLGDATIESVYAPIWIRDPINVAGDQVEIGPRAVIATTATGAVGRVDPAPPPQAASGLTQQLQQALFNVTGTAPVRIENEHQGSNISGRMIHAIQQPQEGRLAMSQTLMGYHIERLTQKMLHMVVKIPQFKDYTFQIQGVDKGKPYHIEATGAEVGGPARIDTKYDALIGSTRHERLVMALQAFAQGLVPGTYVVEQLGEDDPESVIRKAIAEKAMMMQSAQPQMSPPGLPPGGASPGQDPGAQQQAISAPQQAQVAGGAGGDPTMGAGAGAAQPAPPGGTPPGPGGPPPFDAMGTSPAQPGMGPAPMSPSISSLIREAVARLTPDAQNAIVGVPLIEAGHIVVQVKDRKLVASGVIKRAFEAVGLTVKVKVV